MHKTGRLRWLGSGLAVEGESGLGGHIALDATHDEPGLRPTEALLLSLGACAAMDVVAILAKKRETIERYEISLEAEQRDEHPQVLTEIVVTHELEGRHLKVEAVRRSIELSATKYCAVSNTLSKGELAIHHRYRVRNASGTHDAEVVTTGPRGQVR